MADPHRRDLSAIRESYGVAGLDRADLDDDPFAQFRRWFDEWLALDVYDATAVTLATAAADARPSVRFVLLKEVDDRGFVFFTNYEGRKGREIEANPQAALCFGWIAVERQVRVVGAVEPISPAESDAYFASRPLGSQLGAWASAQSEPVPDRAELERRWAAAEDRYGAGPVPRPPHWGGYRVVPDELEFWQGRPDRMHDRYRYTRNLSGWTIQRLMP